MKKPTVFVVDDEPQICALLTRILQREGYAVHAFTAGQQAVDALAAERPDVLVTDLMMPGLNGIDVVRRAKDGVVIYRLDVAKAVNLKAEHDNHGPTIADFDGDGRLDVFLVVGYPGRSGEGAIGEAVCLTGFAGRGPGWTMLRHDPKNTGNVATPVR